MLRSRKYDATASKQVTSRGLVNTSQSGAGLVQVVVVDSSVANLSSQNGLGSTHALAMLLTQTCETDGCKDARHNTATPKREHDFTNREWRTFPQYDGPKKPEMSPTKATKSVLSLRELASQVVAGNRASVGDFYFLSQIVCPNACHEWNGFNRLLNRTEGQTMRLLCVHTTDLNETIGSWHHANCHDRSRPPREVHWTNYCGVHVGSTTLQNGSEHHMGIPWSIP